jgi:2-phosphoglycerate kinase
LRRGMRPELWGRALSFGLIRVIDCRTMFNVCPSCGEYVPERDVRQGEAVAVCRCGHVQEFRPGPLFLVGGASGTGKSTVLHGLAMRELPVVALDGDILWREEFRTQVGEWAEIWLRMAKNIGLAGKPVMLFAAGLVVPENVESRIERRYFSTVHRLALTCDDDVLAARLRSRPAWRRAADPHVLDDQLQFNRWLRDNGHEQGIALVDTTSISVAEARDGVLDWVRRRMGLSSGAR